MGGDHYVGWVGSVKSLARTENFFLTFKVDSLMYTCYTSVCQVSTVVLEAPNSHHHGVIITMMMMMTTMMVMMMMVMMMMMI